MLTTFIAAIVFVGSSIGALILWVYLLKLGLLWAKVEDVTLRGIAKVVLGVIVARVVLESVLWFVATSQPDQAIMIGVTRLAVALLIPCFMIAFVFGTSFLRSIQAWLPTLLAGVAYVALMLLVVRPYIFEAFLVPTNSMAPTLLGPTLRGVCDQCQQTNFCTPPRFENRRDEEELMICGNFHVESETEYSKETFPGDRFLVAKFLRPKRWELAVFKMPGQPSVSIVQRLVGLPGETIFIEEGEVWINGEPIALPDNLAGLNYMLEPDFVKLQRAGTRENPAVLADDEYFVLGDFSMRAFDSRVWEQGAPGHPTYAVPESHMQGVVTHIYWPPERWRILR